MCGLQNELWLRKGRNESPREKDNLFCIWLQVKLHTAGDCLLRKDVPFTCFFIYSVLILALGVPPGLAGFTAEKIHI